MFPEPKHLLLLWIVRELSLEQRQALAGTLLRPYACFCRGLFQERLPYLSWTPRGVRREEVGGKAMQDATPVVTA